MTIGKKAHEYTIKNVCDNCNKCQSKGYIGCDTFRFAKKSYIDGAKESEKIINELNINNSLNKERLDEAKEIIKDLLIVYQQFNQTDTYIRAERFLKG